MPAFVDSPFSRPVLATKGVPVYLLGSYDFKRGNSNLNVTQVALTSDVAAVTGLLLNGPAPRAGDLVSIINTVAGAGEFNVQRAMITAAAVNQATGVCTISFALVETDVVAVADAGAMIVEPGEAPETLAEGASIAATFQAPEGDSQFTVPISVKFPTLPTTATVMLQGSVGAANSEFTSLAPPVAQVVAGAQTIGPFGQAVLQRGYCYRLLVSGVTGSGTIVAKLG